MNYKKVAEKVVKMNPIDNDLLQKMAEDINFCQEIIRVFLNDDSIIVLEATSQKVLKNLQGRSVQIDIYCVSKDGIHFNVEVQKSDDDNHQKRVRYNSACITTNITDTGTKFEKVPNVIIIYITKKDIFKQGKTIYHVDRVIRETGTVVSNGLSEVYVNGEIKDGTNASDLMTVFTTDVYNDKFPATSNRKRYFKEDERGIAEMCKLVEDLIEEAVEEAVVEAMEEATMKNARKTATQMIKKGKLTLEEIAEYVPDLSMEELQQLETEIMQLT